MHQMDEAIGVIIAAEMINASSLWLDPMWRKSADHFKLPTFRRAAKMVKVSPGIRVRSDDFSKAMA
jgi:hypothetical protein